MDFGAALKRRSATIRTQRRLVTGTPSWVYLAPEGIANAPTTPSGQNPSPVTIIAGGRVG
ncbi:MAG: hypothetical protein WBV82_24000 [Myxococcaceae bacterium]